MKKYRFEIILFIINAVYMILELIASRILAPYFGNSNLVWTSIIGIILLSTSIGNYLGGKIADKSKNNENNLLVNVDWILSIIGILILLIPLVQKELINIISRLITDIKTGAIISTILLFFAPSMFVGMLTPIIIKIKMKELENVGKTAGNISALATLGSIIGTFIGGFALIPNFGSTQILFVLSIISFLLIVIGKNKKDIINKTTIIGIIFIVINIICFYIFTTENNVNGKKVLNGDIKVKTNLDTQYGKVTLSNGYKEADLCRLLDIDKGNESATFLDEKKCYELVFEYTKYYDLMFNANKEIKDTLMIGGAGYSYPKYYISHFLDKNMDVVEIDEKVTEIARKYFYLDKLIKDFNLEKENRLNLITDDGRIYLNKNTKKYDAILNDAFSGNTPVKTLATYEAIKKIYNSLKENGVYLTNIISALDGKNSRFLKSEVKTLRQVFKNVYIVPCRNKNDLEMVQNNMVIATDNEIKFENNVDINISSKEIIITDDYCPVESIAPIF